MKAVSNNAERDYSFSVVMAIYSGVLPEQLLAAARSVFQQTRVPNELIVVVDGPIGDNLEATLLRVQLLGQVRLLRLTTNVGPGAARHAGISASNAEIVAIMDSDDICVATRFEKECNALYARSVDIVGGWIRESSDALGGNSTLRTVPELHSDIIRYAKRRSPMNNVTIMFRKQAYVMAGGYSNMRSFEDYDLIVRMIKSGATFYNIQEVLVEVRAGLDMFSRRGGLRQIALETRILFHFYEMGFYSLYDLIFNFCTRITMRLLPNIIRARAYKLFLRSNAYQG